LKLRTLLIAAAITIVCDARALCQEAPAKSAVTVTKTEHPRKRLDFSVDVPAPLDQVWKCFATRAGMVSWLTPDAKIELRPGGRWLAIFPGVAPGGGTILSYAPEQQLTIHAMAPEKFPTVRREGTTAVFTFIALDDSHTRVQLSQVGWKSGREWQDAYEHLAVGNAELLTQLLNRFLHGPMDWAKASR
jgi:uncharacterized protein YndB with AHSA1/START domain